MRRHSYNTFTDDKLADDISLDLSAWNLRTKDCSPHNASGSESVASLGNSGTTIEPCLLSVFNGFNEVADESPLTTDFWGAGMTR